MPGAEGTLSSGAGMRSSASGRRGLGHHVLHSPVAGTRSPSDGRGGGVNCAFLSVTSAVLAFFCSRFFLTRRAALRKLAVFLSLIFMLFKGLSCPARRLLPGAAGQCLEVVEVGL